MPPGKRKVPPRYHAGLCGKYFFKSSPFTTLPAAFFGREATKSTDFGVLYFAR